MCCLLKHYGLCLFLVRGLSAAFLPPLTVHAMFVHTSSKGVVTIRQYAHGGISPVCPRGGFSPILARACSLLMLVLCLHRAHHSLSLCVACHPHLHPLRLQSWTMRRVCVYYVFLRSGWVGELEHRAARFFGVSLPVAGLWLFQCMNLSQLMVIIGGTLYACGHLHPIPLHLTRTLSFVLSLVRMSPQWSLGASRSLCNTNRLYHYTLPPSTSTTAVSGAELTCSPGATGCGACCER
jgi:hypothetical protein